MAEIYLGDRNKAYGCHRMERMGEEGTTVDPHFWFELSGWCVTY